jgi:exodeoxyribonuclease III
MTDTPPLKLISWNVNGLRAVWKKGFKDWVLQTQPDILGLQETKISADQLTPELTEIAGYTSYWTHAQKKGYSGVAIYTRVKPHRVEEGIGLPEFDNEGRVLWADFGDWVFYTIYFPNGQRGDDRLDYKMRFYHAFLAHANVLKAQGKTIVVCGDVNTAHQAIDLARPKENEKISGFLPIERAWMDAFAAAGYIDTFRMFEPGPGHYSWWNMRSRARERNVGWRIDYFFVSVNARDQVKGANIHPDVEGSDHCPVSMLWACKPLERVVAV